MTYEDRIEALVDAIEDYISVNHGNLTRDAFDGIIRKHFPDDSELNEYLKVANGFVDSFAIENKALKATIARLRGLLKQLEWVGGNVGKVFMGTCHVCLEHKQDGHSPDCELAKEIGEKDADSIRPK